MNDPAQSWHSRTHNDRRKIRENATVAHHESNPANHPKSANEAERIEGELCYLVQSLSEALMAAGDCIIGQNWRDSETATTALLQSYMSSLTRSNNRDALRELVSASLWPGRTLGKQLLVIKMRMVNQIATQLKRGQENGTVLGNLNRFKAAFVLYGIFAGALATYLQDDDTTAESADRIIASGVAHVFSDWTHSRMPQS